MIGNLARRREQNENEAMEQTDRRQRTYRGLTLSDHMDRFVTGDGAPRTPEQAEVLTRIDPTLDRPVILFQDVIDILHGAMLAVVGQIACGLKRGNGGWISGVLVGVDDPRLRMVLTAQGFGQKALSRCCIGSVQLTASTKTDRDLREDRDGRKSGRQETAGTTHR
jgi:hypothetical protein